MTPLLFEAGSGVLEPRHRVPRRVSGQPDAVIGDEELGVGGKDGFFDDIKVWNAEPARS